MEMDNKDRMSFNEFRNKLIAEVLTAIDDMELYYKENVEEVKEAEVYDRILSNVSGSIKLKFDLLDMEGLGLDYNFYLRIKAFLSQDPFHVHID